MLDPNVQVLKIDLEVVDDALDKTRLEAKLFLIFLTRFLQEDNV